MKKLICYAIAMLFAIISAGAQNTAIKKTAIFNNFPTKISCTTNELNRAFTTTPNQNINLSFSDSFSFRGEVISNIQRYDNLQTTVIKSAEYSDMIFVLSKVTNKDNSVTYVGHMINRKYADGYELEKDAQNNYQLVKIETDKILQDCSQH